MARHFLGFGNGQDGDRVISSSADYDGANAGCSGTSGTKSLTLDSASTFSNGDIVLIHQSRGANHGKWELNQIASGAGTTSLTLVYNLENTYSDSGANQAQIIEVQQYRSIKINSSQVLSAPAWDGNKGGIISFMANGSIDVQGSIVASAKGFVGGAAVLGSTGYAGEGISGQSIQQQAANGNGGGGGMGDSGNRSPGGGGGGNASAGTAGGDSNGNSGGAAGDSASSSDLTTMVFGGGGGGGGTGSGANGGVNRSGGGGKGGGLIVLFYKKLTVSGLIIANGENGQNATAGGTDTAGGGGGAGGAILLKGQFADIGTNLITALGGSGGSAIGGGGAGGGGSNGVIRIETCKNTGTSNPSASLVEGGHNFCGSGTITM